VRAGRTVALTALVAVAVVGADQASKAIVRASIGPLERVEVIPSLLHLVHARNSGVAFSVFSGGGAFVVVVAIVALGALLAFFLTHLHRRLVWLPTGMLLGGAAGNLVDRARLGAVTDWIQLPHWPAFNLADVCITLGVLVLIYVLERVR
jgi:signal peptidase II